MTLLDVAEAFLRDEVAPQANQLDHDPDLVAQALNGLGQRGLLGLRIPASFGGPGLSEFDFRAFQETVARTSGALAFLQTQHQSAGSMLFKSDNEALKQRYLPKMSTGQRKLGIGFSQLRRGGPPVMRAEKTQVGYELDGHVPWITGFRIFEEFVIGATLPDGQALFAVVPFANTPEITFSPPMKLAAMESAQTVTAEIKQLVVTEDNVLFVKPAGWIQNNDQINVTLQGHFAIGCAQAGIDIVASAAAKKSALFLQEAARALQAELEACRAALQGGGEEATEDRLQKRAWAIELAGRCAHAAVTASSGAANSLAHPAQRVYREALVFTVSAQTEAIMAATLSRLIRG